MMKEHNNEKPITNTLLLHKLTSNFLLGPSELSEIRLMLISFFTLANNKKA